MGSMIQNTFSLILKGRSARGSFALVAFVALIPKSLVAQTVDTAILGSVVDSAGGAVSNATVTLTRLATGLSKVDTTKADGTYEFRYLLPGQYVVEVRSSGFNPERRTGIDIQLSQQAKVDFTLQLGAGQQAIEVKSAPAITANRKREPR